MKKIKFSPFTERSNITIERPNINKNLIDELYQRCKSIVDVFNCPFIPVSSRQKVCLTSLYSMLSTISQIKQNYE